MESKQRDGHGRARVELMVERAQVLATYVEHLLPSKKTKLAQLIYYSDEIESSKR